MSADETCYLSLISLLCFSLQEMMDRLAFDKDQVKGVVLKLSEGCSPKPECKALGVLRSGRSQSASCWWSCVNIHSDVSSKHGPSLRNAEALEKEALHASTHLLGQDSGSAIMVIFLTTYSHVLSLLRWPHTYSHHNNSSSWGKSQQGNDGKVLCSGLLVGSVGADRQDHLRTGAFKIKQDTLGI